MVSNHTSCLALSVVSCAPDMTLHIRQVHSPINTCATPPTAPANRSLTARLPLSRSISSTASAIFSFRIGPIDKKEGKLEIVALQIVKVTRRRCLTPFSTPWSAVPSPSVRRLRARSLLTRNFYRDTFLYITYRGRYLGLSCNVHIKQCLF